MKKIVFLIFSSCTLLVLDVSAQRQNTYFLKNNGEYVNKADSADFIRIVKEPGKGSTLYPTEEFYVSGHRKSYGYSSRIDPPLYEGQFTSFFENDRIKQSANFVRGKMADTVLSYFPNGKRYSSLFYVQSADSTIVYVESVNDFTGAPLVIAGDGEALLYDEDFKYITGKGNFKNGKYDGVWTGERLPLYHIRSKTPVQGRYASISTASFTRGQVSARGGC
jgi:hypothetical protein